MKNKKLSCIMLVDNNPDDNFYHQRIIHKTEPSTTVVVMASATEALTYLQSPGNVQPDLIFLDINMPGTNGWDFMELFNRQQLAETPLIIMLTTSQNPDDQNKALQSGTIADCMTKPLTRDMLKDIETRFFG